MHRLLRGARLVVRAATAAIDLVLLVTTSFLLVPVRPWDGCAQTLGAPLRRRRMFFHDSRRYTPLHFLIIRSRMDCGSFWYGFGTGLLAQQLYAGSLVPQKRRDFIRVFGF